MTKPLPLTLLDIALPVSAQVKPRVPAKVYMHTLSELGEIGEELNIACRDLYKEPGADGVVGEAADIINCIADLLWICAHETLDTEALAAGLASHIGIASLQAISPLADMTAARDDFSDATGSLVQLQRLSTGQISSGDEEALGAAARIIRSVLLCAKTERPGLTDAEFTEIFQAKCDKWLSKAR